MAEGNVKWYNDKKGFGFIETDEQDEFFFHKSNIKNHGFFGIHKDDRVSFDIIETSKGKQAIKIIVL